MANEATSNDTNHTSFNRANPNSLPDLFRLAKVGDLLAGHLPQHLRKTNPDAAGASPYNLATLDALVMPDKAKAQNILRAYARAGAGTLGVLAIVASGTTPGAGEIAVGPNGNIVVLAADAWTDLDVSYQPEGGDVVESFFPVVANVLTLPASITLLGVVLLAEVEVVAGTATGKKIVLVPGAGAPAAGQARLNLAKSTVTFAAADAVTRARVKVVVAPVASEQLQAVLNAAAQAV
jgi:hypothetical protein